MQRKRRKTENSCHSVGSVAVSRVQLLEPRLLPDLISIVMDYVGLDIDGSRCAKFNLQDPKQAILLRARVSGDELVCSSITGSVTTFSLKTGAVETLVFQDFDGFGIAVDGPWLFLLDRNAQIQMTQFDDAIQTIYTIGSPSQMVPYDKDLWADQSKALIYTHEAFGYMKIKVLDVEKGTLLGYLSNPERKADGIARLSCYGNKAFVLCRKDSCVDVFNMQSLTLECSWGNKIQLVDPIDIIGTEWEVFIAEMKGSIKVFSHDGYFLREWDVSEKMDSFQSLRSICSDGKEIFAIGSGSPVGLRFFA